MNFDIIIPFILEVLERISKIIFSLQLRDLVLKCARNWLEFTVSYIQNSSKMEF
jgi:hypothetical protein